MNREDAIGNLIAQGRTREQAEAFLAILGSAFARRGWADAPVLSEDEIEQHCVTLGWAGSADDTREDPAP